VSDDYYPALTQDNVTVVTHAARSVEGGSVVDAAGGAHDVDTIILATGFNATEPTFASRITGRGGERLSERWREGMEAYLGTVVRGFPNLFLLLGPNTVLGHNSVIFMVESQIALVLDFLSQREKKGFSSAEVRQKVQDLFNLEMQRKLATSVWMTGGCASWYLDRRGRNTTLWPGHTMPYRRRTRRFVASEYVLR
jgi:cation diffusion facilitator CzcD-associated flavoprotein CzcO